MPSGPGEESRMFTYKLRHPDGRSADPPSITLAVSNMRVGDTIPDSPPPRDFRSEQEGHA